MKPSKTAKKLPQQYPKLPYKIQDCPNSVTIAPIVTQFATNCPKNATNCPNSSPNCPKCVQKMLKIENNYPTEHDLAYLRPSRQRREGRYYRKHNA